MLDKIVIHLKNIVFFKSIIYLLIIILLGALIPSFKEEFLKSSERRTKAQKFLLQSNAQLSSIQSFEERIYETNKIYKELLANPGKQGCEDRINIVNNVDLISKKLNLNDPIKIEIVRLFEPSLIQNKNAEIKLRDYQANTSFDSNTYEEALNIMNNIAEVLPKGSFIFNASFKKIETLNPQIIAKLSEEASPGLINTSIKIKLREIVYEK